MFPQLAIETDKKMGFLHTAVLTEQLNIKHQGVIYTAVL